MHAHRPESMRRHNERLILTLLRRAGPAPRSQLAQASGLSAQAVTDIVRDLLARGLLTAEGRVRGRVGQPSVPLALEARGAFSLGLQVGRRSARMVLVDFAGAVLASRATRYATPAPQPAAVKDFATRAAAALTATLSEAEALRIMGLGIAMPFRMWDWGEDFSGWRGLDLRRALEAATAMPTWLENDASAACAAELIFGRRDLPADFLHVYVGHFAGGGLVLGGQLWLGPRGNAAAIGSSPVPGSGGRVVQLLERASLSTLEDAVGFELPHEIEAEPDWSIPDGPRAAWLTSAGDAIAFAALSATTTLDLDAVVIDGAMPGALREDLVASVGAGLARLPGAGVQLPRVLAGSLGRSARAIGAAALPLAEAFMLGVVVPSPATGG